jgi:hypothetical protein
MMQRRIQHHVLEGRGQVSVQTYDDGDGLRFEYPAHWELEVTDLDEVRTAAVADPEDLGFALISTDPSRPDPAEAADSALEALRDEYDDLESSPTLETINGHAATGYNVEFFAVDMTNAAVIRCFRTQRRTILVFGQWSDLGPDELADQVRAVVQSIIEAE